MAFVGCCNECGHDLVLVEGGAIDPDTSEREALCSIYGEDHGTHWTNPQEYEEVENADSTSEHSDEGSGFDYR